MPSPITFKCTHCGKTKACPAMVSALPIGKKLSPFIINSEIIIPIMGTILPFPAPPQGWRISGVGNKLFIACSDECFEVVYKMFLIAFEKSRKEISDEKEEKKEFEVKAMLPNIKFRHNFNDDLN